MTVVTVILAGGAGSRIGGAKPDRILGGARLIAHALDAASRWRAPVAVAVREPVQAAFPDGAVILDDPAIQGPLAGLASALAWAKAMGADRVLTIPCDMPFLPPDLLALLEAALGPDDGVAVAASGGRLHPVCALWRVQTVDQLHEEAAAGRLSLTGLSEKVGRVVAEWPVASRDPFLNVNTREDLRAAEILLKRPAA